MDGESGNTGRGNGWKQAWMDFVHRQTIKTARDPHTKSKTIGWVIILLIIGYGLPKSNAGPITCGPCVAWAAKFCSGMIAAGGACASVAAFPPLLCACMLTAGGLGCVAAAGTCTWVCFACPA